MNEARLPTRSTELPKTAYAVMLVVPPTATAIALSLGAHATLAALLPMVGLALVLVMLERRRPWSARAPTQPLSLDVLHLFVASAVVAPLIHAAIPVLLALVLTSIGATAIGTGWPHSWPLALQVMLAAVIADLGAYTFHRATHESELGWRIHVLHHSLSKLTFIRGARTHPLNAAAIHGLELLGLLALGINADALLAWTVLRSSNSLLQHADVAFPQSPLDAVVATAEVHRWHHSARIEESNHNFGNLTMVWDQVFRTWYRPRAARPTTLVGVEGLSLPTNYTAHLAIPIAYPRWLSHEPTRHLDHGEAGLDGGQPVQPPQDVPGPCAGDQQQRGH